MANITDRTAYLRGLAEGMKLDANTNENKLLLEMLNVLDELAHQVADMDEDVGELQEYVEDMDSDLSDMEDVLFGDEDDDDEDDDELDEEEELSFDCPNCGKTVMIKAADIDFDESPVCDACGKPFFLEEDEEAEDEDENGKDE